MNPTIAKITGKACLVKEAPDYSLDFYARLADDAFRHIEDSAFDRALRLPDWFTASNIILASILPKYRDKLNKSGYNLFYKYLSKLVIDELLKRRSDWIDPAETLKPMKKSANDLMDYYEIRGKRYGPE